MKQEKPSEITTRLSKEDLEKADAYYFKRGMFSVGEAFSIASCYFNEVVDVLNANK